MHRRRIGSTLIFAVLLAALATGIAVAGEHSDEAFSEDRFRTLQAENALILVDVSASWCGTCSKQADLVARYRETHPGVPLHVLRVDFDSQKEWVKYFEAPRQSTLLLYRGEERVWFAVAETREEVVFSAIDAAAAG